jgi:dihydroflavonol-4-reductase
MADRILITGATGFIGQHLVHRLRKPPAPGASEPTLELRALARSTSDTSQLESLGVEIIEGDVTDWQAVVAAVDGCRRVVHLANVYSFWERDPSVYWRVNVEGTRRVALAAAEAGVELFVHVSTVAVFGRPADVPFHEDSAPGVERFSDYAITKYEADVVVGELARTHGLPVSFVYPASVLGPGDPKVSGRYIADILRRRLPAAVFSDDVMTWVHVRDVAESIARLLDCDDAAGRRYILGGHRLTFHQLNELIREVSGVRLPRWEMPDWLAIASAWFLTAAATVLGRPPLWGLSADTARTVSTGVQADGSRVVRDLGLSYTDIRTAVADTIHAID